MGDAPGMTDFLLDAPALRILPTAAPLRGRAAPPGSKSITNRALLLAALARGHSRITGALASDDTARMAEALAAMGVAVDMPDATTFAVHGTGILQPPAAPLFLGNAGTATRFLTAAVALAQGKVVVDGDAHMRKRPILPLVQALVRMGVTAEAPTGCPPVTIHGTGRVAGGTVDIDAGLSSQYVSALLMLAACADGPVDVRLRATADGQIGARGYIDLTLAAMRAFGAQAEQLEAGLWRVQPTGYRAAEFDVEPDASAATYLWAAEVLTGGAIDLGRPASAFTQPDAAAQAVIAQFPRLPAVIDGAQMQDAIPTIAVLAAFNATPVRFIGIANLRVKECDRVSALSQGLNRLRPGLAVEEGDDLLVASDPGLAGTLAGNGEARIETFADHRIAMGFSLAGLVMPGVVILDPGCVAKTFPGYWRVMQGLGARFEATT